MAVRLSSVTLRAPALLPKAVAQTTRVFTAYRPFAPSYFTTKSSGSGHSISQTNSPWDRNEQQLGLDPNATVGFQTSFFSQAPGVHVGRVAAADASAPLEPVHDPSSNLSRRPDDDSGEIHLQAVRRTMEPSLVIARPVKNQPFVFEWEVPAPEPAVYATPIDNHYVNPMTHGVSSFIPSVAAFHVEDSAPAHEQDDAGHDDEFETREDLRMVKPGWWTSDEDWMNRGLVPMATEERVRLCSEDVRILFLAVLQTGEKFGLGTPIKVLMGHKRMTASPKLRMLLETSDAWGRGKHNPYALWRAVAFALIELGPQWLCVNNDPVSDNGQMRKYVTYCLGPAARHFLRNGGPLPAELVDALSEFITRDVSNYLENTTQRKKDKKTRLSSKRFEVYRLFEQGMAIHEIAALQGIGLGTVTGHLAECLEQGYPVEFARLGISDAVVAAVLHAAATVPTDGTNLKPLKRALPSEITYEAIRCVLARQKMEETRSAMFVNAAMAILASDDEGDDVPSYHED